MFVPVRYNGIGIKPWKVMGALNGANVEVGTAVNMSGTCVVTTGIQDGLVLYMDTEGVDFEAPRPNGDVSENVIGAIFAIPPEGTTSLGSSGTDPSAHGFLATGVDVARKMIIGRFV